RAAGQMKVRNAVARTVATRMAAEGDRLPLRIAAIGIAAITVLKVEEGKMARHDGDAAQIQGRGARQNLHQPPGGLKKTRSLLEQPPKAWWPGLFRSSGTIGLACAGDPHALGATDRGITAVGSVEAPVDRPCRFRIGHPLLKIFTQRLRVLLRPV